MKSISRTSSLGRLSIIVEGEIDSRSFDRDTFPVIGCSGWINKHWLGSGRNCCNGETLAHFPQGGSDRGNGLERRGRKIRMDFYYYYYYYFRKTKGDFALEAFGERSTLWRNVIFFLSWWSLNRDVFTVSEVSLSFLILSQPFRASSSREVT